MSGSECWFFSNPLIQWPKNILAAIFEMHWKTNGVEQAAKSAGLTGSIPGRIFYLIGLYFPGPHPSPSPL
jgi:hypothetical protein